MKKFIKNIGFSLFFLSFLCGTQLFGMKSRLFHGHTTKIPFDFLKDITGMPEYKFSKLPIKNKLDFYKEKIAPSAGTYRQYSIKYLRKKETLNEPFKSYGFFKIMRGTTIQEIMGNRGFKNAVIISASNVNTLEGGMGKPKSLLSGMQKGAVQGETVKTCAAFCDIENKYFPRLIISGKREPINLLHAIRGFKISQTGRMEGIPKSLTKTDYEKICIGYRRDTKVFYEADREHTYTHKNGLVVPMLKRIKQSPYKLGMYVDIAMAFAIDLNPRHIRRWQYDVYDKNVRNVAKQVVKAMYELGIRASFHNGKQKFVITLIGTNAFKNLIEWAIDGIRNMKNFAVKKNMQIFLVIPSKTYSSEIDDLKKEFDIAFKKQRQSTKTNH